MGLPFVVLNMVSAVLFKDMGVSDAQIAFWTSLIMWPWTIKFLWSPFLELFRSQKFFVVATQLVSGLLFGFAALALHLLRTKQVTGVLQVGIRDGHYLYNGLKLSRTEEEVRACARHVTLRPSCSTGSTSC